MTPFAELAQQNAAAPWLFIPSAILLGALHGLEPGHSKTMMAAFIVAIRGTIPQAALLAVTATISHTAVVRDQRALFPAGVCGHHRRHRRVDAGPHLSRPAGGKGGRRAPARARRP